MSLNLYKYHTNPETITGFDQVMNSVPDLAWEHIVGTFEDEDDYLDAIETGEIDLEELRKREHVWAKSAEYSYLYAKNVLSGERFVKGEDAIATNAEYSYAYASYVLKGRFEKGEDAIATSALYSYAYAKHVLKGERVEKIEDAIATDAWYSYRYARDVLKGERVEKFEDAIATSAHYSYMYAAYVLKKRFPKGEDAIHGSEYQEDYEQEFGIKL